MAEATIVGLLEYAELVAKGSAKSKKLQAKLKKLEARKENYLSLAQILGVRIGELKSKLSVLNRDARAAEAIAKRLRKTGVKEAPANNGSPTTGDMSPSDKTKAKIRASIGSHVTRLDENDEPEAPRAKFTMRLCDPKSVYVGKAISRITDFLKYLYTIPGEEVSGGKLKEVFTDSRVLRYYRWFFEQLPVNRPIIRKSKVMTTIHPDLCQSFAEVICANGVPVDVKGCMPNDIDEFAAKCVLDLEDKILAWQNSAVFVASGHDTVDTYRPV